MIEAIAAAVVARLQQIMLPASKSEALAFSMKQTAEMMCVSLSTLKKMISMREIAVVRRGAKVLITRKAIEDWFERNEV